MRCQVPRACGRWIVGAAAYARRKGREGSGEGQPIDLSREDTSRVRHEGAVRAWDGARTGRGWEVFVTRTWMRRWVAPRREPRGRARRRP